MKFNTPITTRRLTENRAGGEAYDLSPKLELVSLLLTSFVEDQFYRSKSQSLQEVCDLVNTISDKKFVAKAALYARREFYMRSISHVVAGEIAYVVKGESWTKNFINKVVTRPDDMLEILSYYIKKYGKPIPNSLKKGLASSFHKFDEYQIAKYRGEGRDLKMVDLVNLVHVRPEKASSVLEKLMSGTLKSTQTWESKLSKAGQVAENDEEKASLKEEAWEDLLKSGRLGYMALLKNLRNIAEQAPDSISLALNQLINEEAIKKSMVLPFRFSTAHREIKDSELESKRNILIALNKAVDLSLKNVPDLPGKTAVVLDTSGSMGGMYGSQGNKTPIQIGSLFASVLYKGMNADLVLFSETARFLEPEVNDSTFTIQKEIFKNFDNGGTNFHSIFRLFEEEKKKYDRIIILSDGEAWMGYRSANTSLKHYKKAFGIDPKVYSFDLQGYGTIQFPESNTYFLSGFSDKVFDLMNMLERDKNAMVREIEEIEL